MQLDLFVQLGNRSRFVGIFTRKRRIKKILTLEVRLAFICLMIWLLPSAPHHFTFLHSLSYIEKANGLAAESKWLKIRRYLIVESSVVIPIDIQSHFKYVAKQLKL